PQYNHLIPTTIPHLPVYTDLFPYNTPPHNIPQISPPPIIFSAPPSTVYPQNAPHLHPPIYHLPLPIFPISYGIQLIPHHLQPKVQPS
ncbi:glutamine amidotransferase-related protein, partial [Paenibacillus xylanexedens]|uniref:glutamine amidotransferase-related protein n=1 Tax=Paenibacillus xylanexedens TaxID=528191 RepID=UPI003F7A5FDC